MTERGIWLRTAASRLTAAGVDAPRLCAELLLAHALGVTRTELHVYPERPVPPAELAGLEALLSRRAAGEPMAYLLGEREFYGRSFAVTPDTLIPRPETEHLVELALERCPEAPLRFVDLGTGSGCIAVTLCAERPSWQGLAVDKSRAALRMARRNATALGVESRLHFVQADFCKPVLHHCQLVVSNPPYIASADYAALDPGVRLFEPAAALTPGPSGLEHLAAIAEQAVNCLQPGGWLLMEHALDQGTPLRLLLKNNHWKNVFTFKDLAGLERITGAQRTDFFSTL